MKRNGVPVTSIEQLIIYKIASTIIKDILYIKLFKVLYLAIGIPWINGVFKFMGEALH